MRRLYAALFILFVIGCVGGATGKTVQSPATQNALPIGIEIGNRAPDFAVQSIDRNTIRLSDITAQKKPVVVEFIATWCPYCYSDLTESKKVYGQYSDDIAYIVIGLDIKEHSQQIKAYRDSNSFLGSFAMGNRDVLVNYNVISTTTKFAIDRNGVIIWKGSGSMEQRHWKTLFSALRDSV